MDKLASTITAYVDNRFKNRCYHALQIRNTLYGVLQKLTGFNKSLQDGEFDMDAAAAVTLWNTVPPIVVRAEAYKGELKDAETLKYKLENKVGQLNSII